MSYKTLSPPQDGEHITMVDGRCVTPDRPIVPYIEGDGIGTDIWRAAVRVFDAAVEKAYEGDRKIEWFEVLSGEKAKKYTNEWMPEDTYEAFREFKVGIKGPLTTPVGGGFRSLNVTLRQVLDLYACVRPVRWFVGVPAPVKQPYDLDFIIFRENTEDVYSGIEYEQGSEEANKLIKFLHDEFGAKIRPDSGIGVKPISISGTERFVRKTIQYALDHRRRSVTLVHKGNIMKFTEGAFREWGYDLVKREFADECVTEADLWDRYNGEMPEDKLLVKDRIADNIFQQILLRPDEYDILCAPNLNGDYLSDAAAAQVGGLGMAPGANIGDEIAIFEATHGTAPKYAGKDVVNPSSVILSGEMMLRYMGWDEAADLVIRGVENAVSNRLVTQDLHRQMNNATLMKCSEFGTAIIEHMD